LSVKIQIWWTLRNW